MGWFRLVNALSKIEARRPKETFFIKITTVVESAVLPQGRAPSSGNDEEKSACDRRQHRVASRAVGANRLLVLPGEI